MKCDVCDKEVSYGYLVEYKFKGVGRKTYNFHVGCIRAKVADHKKIIKATKTLSFLIGYKKAKRCKTVYVSTAIKE